MTDLPGVEQALTDQQIRDLLDLTNTIDRTLPADENKQILITQHGWTTVRNGRLLKHPAGVWGGFNGSFDTTATWVAHSLSDVHDLDVELHELRHLEHVRELVTHVVGQAAVVRERDGRNHYCWDLPDHRRIWLNTSRIEVTSPRFGDVERYLERDPEKYASYGAEGEYA